ncbi:hypothetical protein AALP_AAs73454U000100 [Arabis alpina]|uniref:Uncharacterized protein n=1 Tax=Arabis alpina TaxID=50452 RepID=A0A087G202_ARAAL|nr:hypothetical protein AALP_AAs73454U000100 [Arabis alpina]
MVASPSSSGSASPLSMSSRYDENFNLTHRFRTGSAPLLGDSVFILPVWWLLGGSREICAATLRKLLSLKFVHSGSKSLCFWDEI